MHRIDGTGHQANMFTEGDPVLGILATRVTKDWLNALQEEVAAVVETSGAALNKPDNTQLLTAILNLLGGRVQLAEVIVSSAELLALNAVPKQLVAAPGAGKAIVLEDAKLHLPFNSVAYAGIAAGEDLALRYTGAAGQIVAQVEATGFLDQATNQFRHVRPLADADKTPAANAPLVLHMLVGEIITGNSTLKLRVRYRIEDVAW